MGYDELIRVHRNPLHDLTEEFAACMRRNNVKRASGDKEEYERALKIAKAEIHTLLHDELECRAYQWVLPKE